MLGIPSSDQLSALIKQAIDQGTAGGQQIEAATAQALHDQLHASLTEVFAGLTSEEAPLVAALEDANKTFAYVVSEVSSITAMLSGGFDISVKPHAAG